MATIRGVVVALLIIAGTWADQTDLEKRAAQIIEDFRAMMPTGRSDIGIPVLEPAMIDKLPINVKISPFDASCVASDIHVAGVSGFKFTKLSQKAGTTQLQVAVELPDIDVSGHYDLDGKVKIGFFTVPLKGDGPLTMTLKGVKGVATAAVLVNNDGSLNLASLVLESWTYDTIKIDLENVLGGGVIGKTVNSLINKLAPVFINVNRAKINNIVETLGTRFINVYLDGVFGKQQKLIVTNSLSLPLPWTIPDEANEILDQLALLVVASTRSSSLVGRVSVVRSNSPFSVKK